jgi:hypothetical protein
VKVSELTSEFKELRPIAFPNLEAISTRWQKDSQAATAKVLCKAWAEIPITYRADLFTTPTPAQLIGRLQPDHYMLPFINIQNLQDKKSFIVLLDARSRHAPYEFARTELSFAPVGQVELPDGNGHLRAPLLKMQFNAPTAFGNSIPLTSEEEALSFESDGKGLSPIAGLQVVYIQVRLLDLLLFVAKDPFQDKLDSIHIDLIPAESAPLS